MRNQCQLTIKSKQEARECIWSTILEQKTAAFPFPIAGRIPNFVGASQAAQRFLKQPIWSSVKRVKCNPDSPQCPLRLALLKSEYRMYCLLLN